MPRKKKDVWDECPTFLNRKIKGSTPVKEYRNIQNTLYKIDSDGNFYYAVDDKKLTKKETENLDEQGHRSRR